VEIDIRKLKRSTLYSEELCIRLKENSNGELFKWFLASILFGARISETIAKRTYKTFERYSLLEPTRILKAGWNFLINPIMREGGYVGYDGKTSTQILGDCETLIKKYDGSLKKLHNESRDSKDLENRLMDFYGIGSITMNIFFTRIKAFLEKGRPCAIACCKGNCKEI